MAEFVEKKLEETIPELEELERTGLLSSEEVRQLIIKRRHHLYKTGAVGPCKSDFVASITFEAMLLELLKFRRQELRMFEKYDQIENVMIRRQELLLRHLTRHHGGDLSLWDMRINFAKSVGHKAETRTAYKEMTMTHARRLSVWVDWAQFEMTVRKDFRKARQLLLSEAPAHHPNNRVLRRELFRFELLQLEYLFQGRLRKDITNEGSITTDISDSTKVVLSGGTARLVYEKTVQEFTDCVTAVELYYIAARFPFARDLRERIYADIVSRFGSSAVVILLQAVRGALGLPVAVVDTQLAGDGVHSDVKLGDDDGVGDCDVEQPDDDPSDNGADNDGGIESNTPCDDEQSSAIEENDSVDDDDDDEDDEQDRAEEESENDSDADEEDSESEKSDSDDESVAEEENSENEKSESENEVNSDNDESETTTTTVIKIEDTVDEYLRPFTIYAEMQKEKFNKMKEVPVVKDERLNKISKYLRNLASGFKSLKTSPQQLQQLLAYYLPTVTALLYHCWHCPSTRTLVAQHLHRTCVAHRALMTPQQMLAWATMATHCPPSGAWSAPRILQAAAALHATHQPTLVYVLRDVVEHCVDNAGIIGAYEQLRGKLSPEWQRVALLSVMKHLRQGDDRTQFLDHLSKPSTDRPATVSTRLAIMWTRYQDKGLDAAREVYTKYKYQPPLSDCLHVTMCLLELYGPQEQGGSEEEEEEEEEEDEEGVKDEDGEKETDEDKQEGEDEDDEDEDEDEEEEEDEDEEDEEESQCELVLTPKPDISKVRDAFEASIRRSKGKHHDVWLAYRVFEELFGNALTMSRVTKRAEDNMEGWSVQAFREMLIDIRDKRYLSDDDQGTNETNSDKASFVEPIQPKLLAFLPKKFLPKLAKCADDRTALFTEMAEVAAYLDSKPTCPRDLEMTWYNVLTLLMDKNRLKPRLPPAGALTSSLSDGLHGTGVSGRTPSVKEQLEQHRLDQQSPFFVQGGKTMFKKNRNFNGSDALQVSAAEENAVAVRRAIPKKDVHDRDDIDAVLARSKTLQPEYIKKSHVEEEVAQKLSKKEKKKKKAKDSGAGWDFMKAPEMTPEVMRDLELIQMRGILDPKQRFKSTHMKVIPKYFQMGTMVCDPIHFYSGRMTKKERKNTFAEQIMDDQDVMRYQKRKYSQLIAKRQASRSSSKKRKTGSADYIKV